MIAFFRRYFARKRLRPIVGALPRQLAKGYGTSEHYTFGQARHAISALRLPSGLERYALAAACTREELVRNGVALAEDEYKRLRAELAEVFHLDPRFTIKRLLATPWSQENTGHDSLGVGVGASDAGGGHGGSGADSGS
jgi:hypothetical protein